MTRGNTERSTAEYKRDGAEKPRAKAFKREPEEHAAGAEKPRAKAVKREPEEHAARPLPVKSH